VETDLCTHNLLKLLPVRLKIQPVEHLQCPPAVSLALPNSGSKTVKANVAHQAITSNKLTMFADKTETLDFGANILSDKL